MARMAFRWMGTAGVVVASVLAAHLRAAQAPVASSATDRSARSTQPVATVPAQAAEYRALLDKYCVACHNERLKTGGLALEKTDLARVGAHAEVLEKVLRKVRGGAMPPEGRPRPDAATTDAFVGWLQAS